MRRTEYLITELRKTTDNVDTTAVKDAEIIAYLNYGQKLIQNIIFKQNPKADIFKSTEEYDATSDHVYPLEDDQFGVNAISLVEAKYGSSDYSRIDRVEKGMNESGYYTQDGEIVLQALDSATGIRVTRFKSLPRMDKRWGSILSVTPSTSIVLNAGYDSDISTVDDYVSVVDKFGAKIRGGIFVDSYSGATLNTTDALTSVTTSHYVCTGKDSVNASLLPDACEPYLLDYARKRLVNRNNYNDGGKQADFTAEEKAELASLFANVSKDTIYPPITDWDAVEF